MTGRGVREGGEENREKKREMVDNWSCCCCCWAGMMLRQDLPSFSRNGTSNLRAVRPLSMMDHLWERETVIKAPR